MDLYLEEGILSAPAWTTDMATSGTLSTYGWRASSSTHSVVVESDDVLEVIGTDSTDGRTAYSMVGLLMDEEEESTWCR